MSNSEKTQPIHPLRQRMIAHMTLRCISETSQCAYVRCGRNCCARLKLAPGALILVLITVTVVAKAAITGFQMIAGTAGRTGFARFQGVSLLLTGSLVFLVWLLSLLQLIITVISAGGGYEIGQFTGEIAAVADTLRISRVVAGFAIFYLILELSLGGYLNRVTKAIAAGAAAGTVAFVFVAFLFQLYLCYSVLGALYGALASLIFGFVWPSARVMLLLLGAALAAEWSQAWGEDGADAAA